MKRCSFLFMISLLALMGACSKKVYVEQGDEALISAKNKLKGSTPAGNLVTTAMRETYDLDVVMYPTELLDENAFALLKKNQTDFERQQLIDLFPAGTRDQFILGSMSGEAIK